VSDTAIAIILAVSAGFAYALASVLQQHAASEAAPELSLRPGLLLALLKRPLWLFGTLVDGAAYALEASSLALGSIIIVQPLLVTGPCGRSRSPRSDDPSASPVASGSPRSRW